MACSLANRLDTDKERCNAREAMYNEAIAKLPDHDAVVQLLVCTVNALEENPDQDFLGSIYMELGLSSHWKGQFFTPWSVAYMMAHANMSDAKSRIEQKGYITINDPSCGAGVTLIAAASALRNQGINYQQNAFFCGNDIDSVTAMMAYIQLSLLGCAGWISINDTLCNPVTGPVFFPNGNNIWYMPAYFFPEWTYRIMASKMDRLCERAIENGTDKN